MTVTVPGGGSWGPAAVEMAEAIEEAAAAAAAAAEAEAAAEEEAAGALLACFSA